MSSPSSFEEPNGTTQDIMEHIRAVNDALNVSGSCWDDQLEKVITCLNLPTLGRRQRRRKSEAQMDGVAKAVPTIDGIKMAASVILFSSTSHLCNLNGTSRLQISRLIRQTALMASQSENDTLRTVIGKSQSRLIKKLKYTDRTSISICIETFTRLISASSDIEMVMSNSSIQMAFIQTLSLLSDHPNSTKTASISRLALMSPSIRSLLISTLKKQVSAKILPSSLIDVLALMVEVVSLNERKIGARHLDSLIATAKREDLHSSDVGDALAALQEAWTMCLEAKPPASSISCFDSFFHCLTQDDLTSPPVNLLAVCSRHIRRSPESSLPTLSHLFNEIRVDISAAAPSLLSDSGLIDCLKSDKPALQIIARDFLTSIISQVSDVSSISQCLKILYDPLHKGQAVKVHEKLGLLEAFHSATLCRFVPLSSLAEVLPQYFSSTGYFLSKGTARTELQESVRYAAIQVTGRFLQICGISGPIAKDICELYRSVLSDPKSSDRLRHSVISATSLALDGPLDSERVDVKLMKPTIESVIHIVSSQAAKPTARIMCLEGLLALLRLERLHSGIFSGTISTEAIRPIITSPESFFNSLTTIGKASPYEISVQFQIVSLMFSLPFSTAFGLPFITPDPISKSITLSEFSDLSPSSVPFPPICPSPERDLHFRPFFRSAVGLLISLFHRNLWSVAAESLTERSHSNISVGTVPVSARLNLRKLFCGFGDAPELLRLMTRGFYDLLTEMSMLKLNLDKPSKDWLLTESQSTLFVDVIPSRSSFKRTLKSVLGSLSSSTGITDDLPTLFSLCACHPLVGSVSLSQNDINSSAFVDNFMIQSNKTSGDHQSDHSYHLTVGPNLATVPKLLSSLLKDDPSFDSSGFRYAFIASLALVNPSISYQLEQNNQPLPYGYGHNEIVECSEQLGHLLVSQLPSDKLAELTPQDLLMYFAPEGVLFIEDGVYVAHEVENKNIKLNKFQKELYGDATAEVMKASARPKAVDPKAKPKAKIASGNTNKTKSDIENDEIAAQSRRRVKLRRELRHLEFAMKCIGTLCIVNPSGIKSIMSEVIGAIVMSFKCPLSFIPALNLSRILAHKFISSTVLPTPHLVPDALYRSALGRLPVDDETCEMLKEVSNSDSLSRPAAQLMQPIINFILLRPADTGPKCCLAALEFIVRQLKTDDPQLSPGDLILCIDSILRNQPARVALGSVALDAICSKLLEDSLVRSVTNIGVIDDPAIRFAVVSALRRSRCSLNGANAFLFCCKFDSALSRTVEVADTARETFGLVSTVGMLTEIEEFLACDSGDFREMAAIAFAQAAKELSDLGLIQITQTLERIVEAYKSSTNPSQKLGLVSALSQLCKIDLIANEEDFRTLFTFLIGYALNDSTLSLQPGSKSAPLFSALQSLGLNCIASMGAKCDMNAVIEGVQSSNHQGPNSGNRGAVDAAVALFLGAIAKFMNPSDPTVNRILERLLVRISDSGAPTREVQRSIADVLPPLVKSCHTSGQIDSNALIDQVLNDALSNESFVSRNGFALALAAIVKGLGIASMKENDLIKKLIDAAEDKNNALRRQGSLLCFEALSEIMGRLFEPYIVHILGTLLNAFSDSAQPVRTAAQKAANVIMGHLSGHGVKLVLPNLLTKVVDKQWRTKLGAIELLGAMAHCAPKQLAALLPQVVPQLCEVISDSNSKVKEASRDALQTIASVITNQEIRNLSDVLLTALTQPSNDTAKCALDALLKTEFINPVDSPSLALICPIVVRALRERGSETKKKAAAIVASMVYLCNEPKDFLPYFPQVGPQLQETLLDPIPDVRSVAAKALGTIAKGLGDENLGDLLPWLLGKLKSNESSVERSGAANGLSEVLAALGVEKLAELLPSILQNAEHSTADVREGYLGLFVFLPAAFGNDFQRFVPEVLPVLLRGLSSEVESLREVAFRAAEVLVVLYGASHSVLLLTPLEDGVFNADWRIRHSSVSLLGTLVDRLLRFAPSGFSGNLLDTEVLSLERRAFILSSMYIVRSDENPIVRQAATTAWKEVVQNTPKTLKEILPILLRRLIANLAAPSPEKQKVAARCIGELSAKMPERVLPKLIPSCLETLKMPGVAPRHGACIGLTEMIQHAPAASLLTYSTQLIPAIQNTLSDESNAVRQAGTQCLRHLLDGLGADSLDSIISDIITSIVHPPTFNVEDLDQGPRSAQLSGLEVLIETQTQSLLPAVLSACLSPPSDLSKLRLIGSVAAIRTVHTITNCIPKLLPALIGIGVLGLYENPPTEIRGIDDQSILGSFDSAVVLQEASRAATRLFKRVPEEGVQSVLDVLTQTLLQDVASIGDLSSSGKHKIRAQLVELGLLTEHDVTFGTSDDTVMMANLGIVEKDAVNPYKRAMIIQLVDLFIQTTANDMVPYIPQLLSCVVPMALCDPSEVVQEKATQAFGTLATLIKKNDPTGQAVGLRAVISKLTTDPVTGKDDKQLTLYGLSKKNALEGFYSLYHSGLVVSGADVREVSALGLSELIAHCPPEALKAVAVKLTGPLIRAAAERVPPAVKAAVINTLRILLLKAGPFLKPLLPQLQISFVKAVPDPSAAVRRAAASGLGCLAELAATRTEALVSELCVSVTTQPDPAVKASVLSALSDVLSKLPQKCSEQAQSKIILSTETLIFAKGTVEVLKTASAECLGALLARHASPERLLAYLKDQLEPALLSQDTDSRQGTAMLLAEILRHPDVYEILTDQTEIELTSLLDTCMADDRTNVRRFGVAAFGCLVSAAKKSPKARSLTLTLLKSASQSINSFCSASGVSVLQTALKSLKRLARLSLTDVIKLDTAQRSLVILPAVNSLTLPHPGVKLLAERAIFYALGIPNGAENVNLSEIQLSKTLDAGRLQLLNEYTRRVLSKMSKSFSDSEGED